MSFEADLHAGRPVTLVGETPQKNVFILMAVCLGLAPILATIALTIKGGFTFGLIGGAVLLVVDAFFLFVVWRGQRARRELLAIHLGPDGLRHRGVHVPWQSIKFLDIRMAQKLITAELHPGATVFFEPGPAEAAMRDEVARIGGLQVQTAGQRLSTAQVTNLMRLAMSRR